MKIAFNPSTVAALIAPPNNKDITFDLRGHNIFARGVKFCGTDTNTWRDIKINNVSIGSNILDLRDGDNTTLTNINGVVTINSTWRPVVDNLTSNSTTSSLSANQGRVLKSLIDGKSDSGHNHDDRYYTKAESNAKYITDIITSINKLTFTRNGSNITKDITVNVVYSQGNLTNISDRNSTTKASSGLFIYNSYNQVIGTNSYSSVLSINTGGTIQIAGNWGDDQSRNLYWRSQSDRAVSSYPWKSWRTILDSENYSSTLDSRYYTESEINNLLSNKLNTSDFNWTNLPGKLVAGNEFNIVNSEFNTEIWFNYLPINDRSKTATITGYHFGNGATGYTLIKASGFIKNGSNSNYVLLGDGGHKAISDFATSSHTHAYLPYKSTTTADANSLTYGLTLIKNNPTNAAHTNHSAFLYLNDCGTPFQLQIPDSSVPYIYKRYYSANKWSGWFKLNAGYADLAGSVAWDNVTGKPSSFTPSAHTHTVFNNNLMIKGTNGISDSASIHLGIGDSDTGFKWISDGVCQIYANNVAVGEWTSGGMNWFINPTVNGNKVWNAGNDGSGSELDADTVDGYHASKFPYINNNGIWRIYGNAAVAALADNTAGLSSWAFGESRNYGITYLGILKPSTETCGINAHGTIAVFGQGDTHLGIASDYGRANLQVFGGNADKIVWRKKVAFTSDIPTVTNYYWANLSVQSSASNTTVPSFGAIRLNGVSSAGTNYITGAAGRIFFGGNFHIDSLGSNKTYINYYTANDVYLCSGSSQGKVGIGTTNPSSKLTVNGDAIIGSKSKYYQRSARGQVHHEFVCDDSDYGGVKITHNATEGSGGPGSYTASLFVQDNRPAHHSGIYQPTVYIQRAGATRIMDPFGIDVGPRVFTVGNDGKVTIGAQIASSVSSEQAIARIQITPYRHTGGPWYIKSKDDPSNSFLTIDYDATECLRIKHDGEVKVSKSLWINNSHFFKQSGTTFTCQGGTTFTLPSSSLNTNTALLWTTASDGARDTGIFYNSSDFAFIANSNDHGAVFAVYDTDVTQDFEAGAREISVPGSGGALWARGGFSKSGSSNDYVLLGGGGHKALSDFAMASSFVRAGNYDSADLNKLDTYSFIKSVNSNNKDTSPKGNTGWYNVIQAVHRNGGGDGPGYIGQIALGMTTNTDDMFFRGRRTDSWKTVIHSGNISSQTVANAYHLRINSANTWSTWYWSGQSGQPSWLWGSNDGTNMYVWDPNNFNVHTAQYLRSLGNQNCQTGRTQNYGDIYSYNTIYSNTGAPTDYTSVIGFGRGIGGTVEIAGGWCNTGLYWRSLRDCCEDWYSWRTVLDSSNYTGYVDNYYWANVKISTSSSTTTSPTVSNLTATSSIRMSNIQLEHTDEINNITNGNIYLNYRNSGNVSLCQGGGKVGISTISPSHELDVMGNTFTTGFGIRPYYLSNSGLLPTISPGDGYTYRCLEIGRSAVVSCIIADRVALSNERGVLIKFNTGFDGQIVLLKDLQNYGDMNGNGYFWVMPSGCKIIRPDGSSTQISYNQISNAYDDGKSRFFVYSYKYDAWIEFYCG